MSINLPGNTAGFSADTRPDPGKGTMEHKGVGEGSDERKRLVVASDSRLQGIFCPLRKVS
jgi:hypothetical protein